MNQEVEYLFNIGNCVLQIKRLTDDSGKDEQRRQELVTKIEVSISTHCYWLNHHEVCGLKGQIT